MYTLANIGQQHLGGQGGEDVYVLELQRTGAGIAAVTSDQRLVVVDAGRLTPTASWATAHGSGTTALAGVDGAPWLVCTGGADGAVAVWDLRAAARAARFEGESSDAPILSMACSGAQAMAVGTELQHQTASIVLWDARAAPTCRARYDDVHSDDVTALVFDAAAPARLLSGSTDGLVNVYDTRVADDDDVTLHTRNHGASIHRAGFLAHDELFALAHDERFALYHADDDDHGDDQPAADQPLGDLRRLLDCQYVADVAPKTDGSGAVIGAGAQEYDALRPFWLVSLLTTPLAHSRHLFHLVFLARDRATQSWALDRDASVGLPGAHGGEIVRSFCFLDDEHLVFTAGEDGNIKAWRPGS